MSAIIESREVNKQGVVGRGGHPLGTGSGAGALGLGNGSSLNDEACVGGTDILLNGKIQRSERE